MKILEIKFIKSEWSHEQIKRVSDFAIYKRWKEKGKFPASPKPHYEVIIIKSHNGYTVNDVYVEPAETYPGESSFGKLGWSFESLEKAEEKFNSLIDECRFKAGTRNP